MVLFPGEQRERGVVDLPGPPGASDGVLFDAFRCERRRRRRRRGGLLRGAHWTHDGDVHAVRRDDGRDGARGAASATACAAVRQPVGNNSFTSAAVAIAWWALIGVVDVAFSCSFAVSAAIYHRGPTAPRPPPRISPPYVVLIATARRV